MNKSIKLLCKQAKTDLAFLKRAYNNAFDNKFPISEWLLDNYNLVEREIRFALRRLRTAKQVYGEDLPYVYYICKEAAESDDLTQSLDRLLTDKGDSLTTEDFEYLNVMLHIAYLNMACRAVKDNSTDLIAKAIGGIHNLKNIDFSVYITEYCSLEKILMTDPAKVYPRMDEQTRWEYRKICAENARKLKISEYEYASQLIDKACKCDGRQRHVGYWIYYNPKAERLARQRGAALIFLKLTLPFLLSVAISMYLDVWWLVPIIYLPLIEAWRPLIEIIAERGIKVRRMPRMEFEGAIPESEATLIVVSRLVPSPEKADEVCNSLLQLARTNGEGAIKVCLLADLKQADKPYLPEDDAAVKALKRKIAAMNKKYNNRFILVVRKRSYINTQGAYAGYERKRGAITELVKYIKTQKSNFLVLEDSENFLKKVKYLILLDSDTVMPMDAALNMVSVAAHPLCQPVIDHEKSIVVEGYGILAPRISTGLESADKTAFTRIMSGAGGVTVYDTLSGDIYQDLFGRSNFAGKGLVNVDAFYACMTSFLPDELILSHDILEGSVLRCGYLSDVEFTDSCPLGVMSYLSRLHRWIRGDWQNIRWLFSKIPTQNGKVKNPLPGVCRYMIFDNIRRSLTPVMAAICLFLAIPLRFAGEFLAETALQSQAAPGVFAALTILFTGGFQMLTRKYHSRVMPAMGTALAQAFMFMVILLQTAYVSLDAIIRAVFRQLFSKKNLLEWVTAADSETAEQGFATVLVKCWPSVLGGILLFVFGYGWFVYAASLLAVIEPFVVYFTRKETVKRKVKLSQREKEKLRSYAASMWGYYEQLCKASDNYLPPDNIQESPVFAVAHRTSPTNIGLMFLCTLAARDFGFIDTETMVLRISKSLDTIEKLEKWHGNLINWYDTRTLEPLRPRIVSTVDSGNFVCCLTALMEGLREYKTESDEINNLIRRIKKIIDETDLKPLYNRKRKLFHIGYDLEDDTLTTSFYDLLMSEARMTSYFAIARRQVPVNHWAALGRLLVRQDGYIGLASWTGTMFEYFMPQLLLPIRPNSLCSEALMFCLYTQRKRASKLRAPWGCSESAYYAFDNMLNYQYKAHGIARLGLKRGLDNEYVVSPYSSFLALSIAPHAALKNLERLESMGMTGRFGFYEAVDFTSSRVGAKFAIIKNYMAHHVGMSFLSILNVLHDNIMQKRFMNADGMQAAKELLEEKIPSGAVVHNHHIMQDVPEKPGRKVMETEIFDNINPTRPRVHFLSNSEWSVAITDVGASISSCQGVDVLRRSDDLLRRPLGVFAIVDAGEKTFSITKAPKYDEDNKYEVEFTKNSADFFCESAGIEAFMKVQVHELLPCEIRRFTLKNITNKPKEVSLLIYMEPSLARNEDDSAHPAFSRLFVHGEYRNVTNTLVFSRRPREGENSSVYLALGFAEEVDFEYELDREKILTRPEGVMSLLRKNIELKKGAGIPDTCAAIRIKMNLAPKSKKEYTMLLTAGRSSEEVVSRLIDCRRTAHNVANAPLFDGSIESRLSEVILPKLLFACGDNDERRDASCNNTMGVHGLWSLSISGDYPIILIEVNNAADLDRAIPYIKLHKKLRRWGIVVDLVVTFRKPAEEAEKIIAAGRELVLREGQHMLLDMNGGIRFINLEGRGPEVESLYAAARYIAPKTPTSIAEIVPEFRPVNFLPASYTQREIQGYAVTNGVFHGDSITITKKPPLPWCIVIANEHFGTLVSDSALGYTWALNSRENKLTPWYNDTRTDNRGELLIIKVGDRYYDMIYGSEATFKRGQALYRGEIEGISYTVSVTVVGMSKRIDVNLHSEGEKDMEIAYYTEPVLGINRSGSRQIISRWENNALVLKNGFNTAVPGYAILTAKGGADGYCCDRASFLCGRWDNRTLCPLVDPCAAVIVKRRLPPKRDENIQFIFGFAQEREALSSVIEAVPEQKAQNRIEINTPDEGLNLLFNHWLPAQIEDCRINGRTGFYQCGGAFGYRDQLQDICALMIWNPQKAKEHILRCAAHQFEEGDVLHWWHPLPTGDVGVRTRCSDDMLWLPYAVYRYIKRTKDYSILDMEVGFLSAPVLEKDEKQRFFAPVLGDKKASIYEHCLRAINTVKLGRHGLPLIGSCDWNDGLSKVGEEGEGESVWLAQFAAIVFEEMAELAEYKGDVDTREDLLARAKELKSAVDKNAWAGNWYVRAFMDDGSPLGHPKNAEMQIDILPQAFAVLSRMQDKERIDMALQAAEDLLVDKNHGIIKLFTPPFDKFDSGYIRGYMPGVRENGGQYTHGAIWYIVALFLHGKADRAYELLKMISPVTISETPERAERYKLEPYAIAADIYSSVDRAGRGGWSLYTGSGGLFYRTILKTMLGISIEGDTVKVDPHLPSGINEYSVRIVMDGCDLLIDVFVGDEEKIIFDGQRTDSIRLMEGKHSAQVTVVNNPAKI